MFLYNILTAREWLVLKDQKIIIILSDFSEGLIFVSFDLLFFIQLLI